MSSYGDVPLFWVLFGLLPDIWIPFWAISGFLGTFLGYSWIFGYLFGLFPDFCVSFFGYSRIFGYHFFLVKFYFFKNNNNKLII